MKFSFPLAYCVLLATVLAAQTSTTETPPKQSENCTVEGHVVLATGGGQPLKKVAIRISSDDAEENSYATLTDAEGHFKIEDMKPGHYNVRIERNGFVEAGKHRSRYFSQTLTVKRCQELKDLVFRMQP